MTLFDLHQNCLQWVTTESSFTEIYKAVTCGQKLKNPDIKNVFVLSGIYHLMVISGAHILFLTQILNKVHCPPWARWPLLIFYTAIGQFSPPATRALIQQFHKEIDQYYKLHTPAPVFIVISILITLLFSPHWLMSFSLPLSGLAALCFSFNFKSPLKTCALIYIVMLPILSMFEAPHPATILINFCLTPVWSFLLFPLTLAAGSVPPLQHLLDPLWRFVIFLLDQLSLHFTSFLTLPKSLLFAWLYTLLFAVIAHHRHLKKRPFL